MGEVNGRWGCDLHVTFRHNWAILCDGCDSGVSKCGLELVKLKLMFNSDSIYFLQAGKARGTQFTCRFMIWTPKGTDNK